MTTIVFRDGTLASDSMAYAGKGWVSPGSKTKIWRLRNGDRLGVSSAMVGAGEKLREWFEGGCRGDRGELPSEFMLVLVKGRNRLFVGNGSVNLSGPMRSRGFAIGSGADFAQGALHMGATAVEAVRVAIALDILSGGPIKILEYQPG